MLIKLEQDTAVSNFTPPSGNITTFFSESDGSIKLKYKKSDGTIGEISGNGGGSLDASAGVPFLNLKKPEGGCHLLVKYDYEGNLASAMTLVDTLNNSSSRELVKGFQNSGSSSAWVTCPADGFGVVFDDTMISVDTSSIAATGNYCYIYYAWYSDEGELSDYNSYRLPFYYFYGSYTPPQDDIDLQLITRSFNGAYTIPSGTSVIGTAAFYGCSGITQVIIPSSVTTIGVDAFNSCSDLVSVDIQGVVTTIGNGAFAHCTNLTQIALPEGLISLDTAAFYDCESLTSITLPSSLTSVSDSVFMNCQNLTDIFCKFTEGSVSGEPWGAPNATITYIN